MLFSHLLPQKPNIFVFLLALKGAYHPSLYASKPSMGSQLCFNSMQPNKNKVKQSPVTVPKTFTIPISH